MADPTPTAAAEATPEDNTQPTPTAAVEFAALDNPVAGFSISYPQEWVYSADIEESYLAQTDDALRTGDPNDGAMFMVMSRSVRDLQSQINSEITPDAVLNWIALNLFRNRGALIGESSPRSFGSHEGVGAQVMWVDTASGARIQAYLAATEAYGMATVAMAMSVDTDWNATWPIFEVMLGSLRLSEPYAYGNEVRGELELGIPGAAELLAGWSDQWTYTSSGDEVVSVAVRAASHRWDPFLEIRDANGRLLVSDDNGGEGYDSHAGAVWLAQPGNYSIYISGQTGAGLYEVEVTSVQPEGGAAEYGQAVEGEITELTEWQVWTFTGTAGDVVEVKMIPAQASLDCLLDLYDPDGLIVAADDPSDRPDATVVSAPLAADGLYRIAARSTNDTVGAYRLEVSRLMSEGGGELSLRQTVTGTILPGETHQYTFEGREADLTTVLIGALGGQLDTSLKVLGPDGVELAADDNSGSVRDARIEGLSLPTTGEYTVVAGAGAQTGGRYWLRVEPTAILGVLAYSDVVSGTVAPGARDSWLFDGLAGDVVTITVTATGEQTLDGYIELFTLNAAQLAVDDDSLDGVNPQIVGFELPETGTYRVVVQGYAEEDQGDYQLVVAVADRKE